MGSTRPASASRSAARASRGAWRPPGSVSRSSRSAPVERVAGEQRHHARAADGQHGDVVAQPQRGERRRRAPRSAPRDRGRCAPPAPAGAPRRSARRRAARRRGRRPCRARACRRGRSRPARRASRPPRPRPAAGPGARPRAPRPSRTSSGGGWPARSTEASPGSSCGRATAATVQRDSVLAAAQHVVELVQRRARIAGEAPRRAQRDARDGAERGRRRALAGHVADHDDRARGRVDHLVEVAAGLHALPRRAVAQGDLAARHLQRLVGREPRGEHVGDLVALAVQARVAQRLADAAPERVRQLEHVVVEAPVGLGGAHHQHAEDALPGADGHARAAP